MWNRMKYHYIIAEMSSVAKNGRDKTENRMKKQSEEWLWIPYVLASLASQIKAHTI